MVLCTAALCNPKTTALVTIILHSSCSMPFTPCVHVRSSLIRLQAEFRAEDHGLHVPQPQLRGDVDYTLDQVAERLLTKDHNAACFLM